MTPDSSNTFQRLTEAVLALIEAENAVRFAALADPRDAVNAHLEALDKMKLELHERRSQLFELHQHSWKHVQLLHLDAAETSLVRAAITYLTDQLDRVKLQSRRGHQPFRWTETAITAAALATLAPLFQEAELPLLLTSQQQALVLHLLRGYKAPEESPDVDRLCEKLARKRTI